MMSLVSRLISILLGLFILALVSYLVRRRKIYNLYAVTWLGLSAFFILIGLFASVTVFIANALGIALTSLAIIVTALGFISTIILHLSIIVSGQHQELKRLEKEISLLRIISPPNR